MRLLKWLALCFIALLGITFASLNAESVSVNYYVGVEKIPLSILVVGAIILGILLGWILSLPNTIRLKMELKRLRRQGMGH